MLLTEARRAARTTPGGELVSLDEQDRSLWDRELIAEGVELARLASSHGIGGEYLIQAQIAALHDTAARSQDTDWRRIAGLYAVLEQMTANPMVSLNGAIAVAMFDGPETGLALLAPLAQSLAGHHRLHATRAHLLEMAGELDTAFVEYKAAANRTTNLAERDYLTMKAARVNERRSQGRTPF